MSVENKLLNDKVRKIHVHVLPYYMYVLLPRNITYDVPVVYVSSNDYGVKQ